MRQEAIVPQAKISAQFANLASIAKRQLQSQQSAQVVHTHQWAKALAKCALQAHIAPREHNQSLCARVVLTVRKLKPFALIVRPGIIVR